MKVIGVFATIASAFAASAAHGDDMSDVRAVLTAEARMFSVYDAKMAPSIYAPDVIWRNPFGVRLRGEADLQRFLTRLFDRPGYRSGKDVGKPIVTDVRLLGPNVACAWGEETSQGQIEDGKPLGVRKSHYLEVLRRSDGAWRVTDEMIMDEK